MAPNARASWMAVVPMPLEPPWIEDRLALGELAAIEQVGPDGEERLGNSRGLARPVTAGQRQRLRFRHDAVLGVAAARDERADVVALAPAHDVRADGRDGSGDLEARQVRHARWRRILAEPLQDVRPIHACGLDAHQQFARSGSRCRPLDQTQDFRAAGCRDLDRFHSCAP